MKSKSGLKQLEKKRRVRRRTVLGYFTWITVLALVGMSIYELTKHIVYSHPGSWTMHLSNIASSVFIAASAGLIAFHKFRTLRRETIRERKLREKLENEVTARIKTEEKLWDSEVRVRAIVDSAVDGIITINEARMIETFNYSAERIFGYRSDEILGKNVSVLMPNPHRADHDGYVDKYLDTGERKIIGIGREVEGIRKNGQVFPLDLAVSEFSLGSNRFFTGIVRDITERRAMEAALEEQRNFTEAILSTSGALIVVLDRQGKIVRFNEACEETTGYRFKEVNGKYIWDMLLTEEQASTVKILFRDLKSDELGQESEYVWLAKDGSRRLVSLNKTALLDKAGETQVIIGSGIDITEHRDTEEKLKRYQEELAHMDRISVMGEMATGLAHELNQPLVAAYSYSKACLNMLRNGQEKSEKFANAVQQIGDITERAGLIIRRLRNFIGKQETRKSAINLEERLTELLKLTEAQARSKQIRIENHIDIDLPNLFADPVQIDQVLLNLIRNSMEAMEQTDTRLIDIRARSVDKARIQVTVKDTGLGIDPSQLEQIFNPFQTTKPDGMGMGLAISRSIIEAHDGRLWAESTANGGTMFHFTLPVFDS